MIKPNNRASPEGKQADLATLEEVFLLWQLAPTPFHRGEGDREAVEGGRLKGGTIKLRRSRHHNPRPEGPSNLRTLRTFGPEARQPSRPKGRAQSAPGPQSDPQSIAFILSIV